MDGIVNFLKPTGLTSSQAIGRVKRAFGRRDVGHLGTLDPFAAGVLPVAVGKATRLFDYYLDKTKDYRAIMRFGYDSDTLDSFGQVVRDGRVPSFEEVEIAAAAMVGELDQVPPAYSAKSVNGVRAYDLARKGITPLLQLKQITVTKCEVVRKNADGDFTVDVTCSAGTYIRCVARDMAAHLGTHAILVALIRTRSGDWMLNQAVTEEELFAAPKLVGLNQLLKGLPRLDVADQCYKKIANGVAIEIETAPDEPFTVYCKNELFGLGAMENGRVRLTTYLHD